ncbi:MAG: cytochrome c oxidase accessory protein CcoG [Hyphomicrobiaceae bacterium]|nr:cytochrome c oxidase accessory protein CcoG [Hyphomicrobiaceae bacterium]
MATTEAPITATEAPAHGVEKIDVAAVNRKEDRAQYASRVKVYPKRARGYFRNIKWLVMAATTAVYYLLPWLRWDRGPGLPNQAVLMDIDNGRIFFFNLAIWPQELYLVTGFLVLSALALFLFTSIAGRVWCGYLCWQTVWTDMMVAVERFWQGDRNNRIRLDKEPWTGSKIFKKLMTHLSWLVIAAATGGAFILYFRDAPTLAAEFFTGNAPLPSYVFFALLTGFTYLLGGIAREQVCIYMCPWPRIQGAMLDSDSLLVTYRDFRGEPRGAFRKSQGWEGRGDCIDCNACVAVCPMGIDIRDGAQLECIQCALCIDACDSIMDKIDKPHGLIAYDTYRSLQSEKKGGGLQLRLIRPRTMLYAGLIAFVSAIMAFALFTKSVLEMNVIAERNPLFVQLSDGSVRNTYTVKILNKRYEPHTFKLAIDGLPGGQLVILGKETEKEPTVTVVPDDLREIRAYVTLPPDALDRVSGEKVPFSFVATDTNDGTATHRGTNFRKPAQ